MVGLVGIALPRVFENKLNVLLSEILNQMGIVSKSEQIGRGRRDIVAYHQGLQIVLEGSYSRADAENDAKKRIEQLSADLAIAIHYCEDYPQELTEHEIKERLKKSTFYVKVVVPEDISNTLLGFLYNRKVIPKSAEEWIKVDVKGLVNVIKESAQFLISEQHIKEMIKKVEDLIKNFVDNLSSHPHSNTIANNIYKVLFRLYGFSIGDPTIIKEVLFAQAGLAILLSSIYYETIRYAHGKPSLNELVRKFGPKSALEKAFIEILEINYQPIFKVAKEIIESLPSISVIQRIVSLATEIASKRTLLRRDFAGKVYHKIVGDWSLRKGLATFFTSIPAAYLLLHLADPQPKTRIISENNEVKINFDVPKICDFACGSGTLLTAAYSATMTNLATKLVKSGIDFNPSDVYSEFHKKFIENCYGFDVLKYATQITALNLAFHNPEVPLKEFNIYALPLGVKERNNDQKNKIIEVSLGSLEFVGVIRRSILGKEVTKIGFEKEEEKIITIEPFDLVVMNPPFTRAGGRWKKGSGELGGGLFGFIPETKRREIVVRKFRAVRDYIRDNLLRKARRFLNDHDLKSLLTEKDFVAYRNLGQAGEGALFLYLAHENLKEGGKLAFVLPKNILSGVSWFLIRTLLVSSYHIEYIIISYDPENGYNFSESTKLSECLLIAKKIGNNNNSFTKFIILFRKPQTSVEAIALANQIKTMNKDGYVQVNDVTAYVKIINQFKLKNHLDNWGKFVYLPNPNLLEVSDKLLDGIIEVGGQKVRIPLTRFNNIIATIGIDSRQFVDNFKVTKKHIPGSIAIIHGGDENVRRKMWIAPNAYAVPINKGKRLFEEKSGRFILPSAIWIDTSHVVSAITDENVLSSVFYVVKLRHEDEDKLKALCLWFNTTWGILSVLMNRQEVRGRWIQLKMAQWRLLPVLDVESLDPSKVLELSRIFDRYKDLDLGRIPNQYNPRKVNKYRLELDKEFLRVFGISIEDQHLLSLYREIYSALLQWMRAS